MILVTGGTGFLGSQLLQALVSSGKDVRCIYRKSILKGVPLEAAQYVDWQEADLLDVVSVDRVMENVEQVYHCAGLVSFDPRDKKALYATNVKGTANVVNACLRHGVKKLLHVSSVAAIGRNKTQNKFDETSQWEESRHNTAYAVTKHEGEMEVWRAIAEGLSAVIVNPTILVGPSQTWEDASAKLIKNSYNGFRWFTRGVNGFVDVEDVTVLMMRLMESDISSERFILNGDNWSYETFFKTVHQTLGTEKSLRYAAPWMGEILWRLEMLRAKLSGHVPSLTRDMARTARMKIYYDHSKILKFLPGFTFTPLEDTITRTCEAFLQHQASPAPVAQPARDLVELPNN